MININEIIPYLHGVTSKLEDRSTSLKEKTYLIEVLNVYLSTCILCDKTSKDFIRDSCELDCLLKEDDYE